VRLKGNKLEFSGGVMWWCETDLKLITWDLPSPQSSAAVSSSIHCVPEGRSCGVRLEAGVLLSSCAFLKADYECSAVFTPNAQNKVVIVCMLHLRNY
jgi:hypothetical protein